MRRLNAPSYLSIIGSCQSINHGICDHIYQSLEYLSIIIIFINHGMYDYSIIIYGDTKVMMVNHGIWSDITWYGPCPKMWDLFPIFGRLSLSTPGNGAFYGTRIYKTWGIIYTSLQFPVLYNLGFKLAILTTIFRGYSGDIDFTWVRFLGYSNRHLPIC